MMKRIINKLLAYGACVCSLIALSQGCIRNDIPYPYQLGDILDIQVAGQAGDAVIDHNNHTVSLTLNDSVDLSRVEVLSCQLSEGATLIYGDSTSLDLTGEETWILQTYPGQEYTWYFSATLQWECRFQVENQLGTAHIDQQQGQILVKVPAEQPLTAIRVLEAKLGPEGSVVSPDPYQVQDFTTPVTFTVETPGETLYWTVTVQQQAADALVVELGTPKVYARRAVLSARMEEMSGFVFEYRAADAEQWLTATEAVYEDGQYQSTVTGLTPQTQYCFRVRVGSQVSEEGTFLTETAMQVPNLSFDNWVKSNGVWYPNLSADDADFWWDSGNTGTSIIGKSPTQPESEFLAVSGEGKQAVRMESTSVLGIFIGGNLFTGEYLRTIGFSGGEVAMGREFTSRPDRMTGYYCYEPAVVNKADGDLSSLKGSLDECMIYVMLADWDEPYIVNTVDGPMMDFDDPGIIALGQLISSESTQGAYRSFELNLEYRSDRQPKYIVISAVASRYADYFTGGEGSLLYVDEFELHYD